MSDYTKHESIDPARMAQWEMASKLPYTLTKGVTATREGLLLDSEYAEDHVFWSLGYTPIDYEPLVIPWPDAAERLRYRDGEPWCFYDERSNGLICDTTTPAYHGAPAYLNRLAAIMCDTADQFMVLHWCIHNLGGKGV